MIFPTLEGLTAREQEEYEAQQRAARGCEGPRHSPDVVRPLGAAMKRISDFAQPGVQYTSRQLLTACRVTHLQLKHMSDAGVLSRTGRRRAYRYARTR